jgi:hypothetical protein
MCLGDEVRVFWVSLSDIVRIRAWRMAGVGHICLSKVRMNCEDFLFKVTLDSGILNSGASQPLLS